MLISWAFWKKCYLALERVYCLVFLEPEQAIFRWESEAGNNTCCHASILTGLDWTWTRTCWGNELSVKLVAIPKSMPCLFHFNQNEAIIYKLSIMLLWLSYKIRIKFHLKTRGVSPSWPLESICIGFTFNTTIYTNSGLKSILYDKILEIEAF